MSSYAAFFSAYNASKAKGNPYSKEEQISTFTGGRTSSLKELSKGEYDELVRQLNQAAGARPDHRRHSDKGDKMRKAIISIFYKMDRKPADAIAWAEKQGVNGAKKAFNEYTNQELFILIGVAEKVLYDYRQGIRKSLTML
jgi:hypothetical protein